MVMITATRGVVWALGCDQSYYSYYNPPPLLFYVTYWLREVTVTCHASTRTH